MAGASSVVSSVAPNCSGGGGPMQQYYNSNGCGGDNGQQQQSYMHMSQSQTMTFSQQRARLLSAGASPTNIRPSPTASGVQQNINNEHHHMLPQHMNRTPVRVYYWRIIGRPRTHRLSEPSTTSN